MFHPVRHTLEHIHVSVFEGSVWPQPSFIDLSSPEQLPAPNFVLLSKPNITNKSNERKSRGIKVGEMSLKMFSFPFDYCCRLCFISHGPDNLVLNTKLKWLLFAALWHQKLNGSNFSYFLLRPCCDRVTKSGRENPVYCSGLLRSPCAGWVSITLLQEDKFNP